MTSSRPRSPLGSPPCSPTYRRGRLFRPWWRVRHSERIDVRHVAGQITDRRQRQRTGADTRPDDQLERVAIGCHAVVILDGSDVTLGTAVPKVTAPASARGR